MGASTQAAEVTLGEIRDSLAAILPLIQAQEAQIDPASYWTKAHDPGANTQATATQGAPVATQRNVCTGLSVVLAAGAAAPTAATATVVLRDGASGVGPVLWQHTIAVPAVAGQHGGIVRDFGKQGIRGTPGAAMTLEFTAAAGANTLESVSMNGFVE